MVFRFDPQAVLARISEAALPPAKAATSPPPSPGTLAGIATLAGVEPCAEKNQWGGEGPLSDNTAIQKVTVGAKHPETLNVSDGLSSRNLNGMNDDHFIANTANKTGHNELAQQLGTPAKVAIPAKVRRPAVDLDAFEERAAIAEHDGGMNREEAERAASSEQGYSDHAALHAAAADAWQHHLEALARQEPAKRGQDCIAAALAFIRDGWAEKAAALGWSEIELFGIDPQAPWERPDRHGVAYQPFTPSAVTAECISYSKDSKIHMNKWRQTQTDGAVLPWEP